MSDATPPAELEDALRPLAGLLKADGYELSVRDTPPALVVDVAAGPDACAECLVPKEILKGMIVQALESSGLATSDRDVHVTYPTDGDRAVG